MSRLILLLLCTACVNLRRIDADNDGATEDIDCDDSDAAAFPDAVEQCDRIDNDCDGDIDEAGSTGETQWFADVDADGYGDESDVLGGCSEPAGYIAESGDCDDTQGDVNPSAEELCDGADNNCDGLTDGEDAGDVLTYYADADGDGFGATTSTAACTVPIGFAEVNGDCDDGDGAIFPGATEVCDGADNDCDTAIDQGLLSTFYADADSDGFGDPALPSEGCSLQAGFAAQAGDCNDDDDSAFPGATEACNETDDDCDGEIDEDVTTTYYEDGDGDGFGDDSLANQACTLPTGFSATGGDCDDGVATTFPGSDEICDAVDNDCDSAVDDGVTTRCYADADADGSGDDLSYVDECGCADGYVAIAGDCDDDDPAAFEGGSESCDGVDNDCDGSTDEGVTTTFYADSDGDGFGDDLATSTECAQPLGHVVEAGDCDDADETVSPAAYEYCDDAIDNDCDGLTDDSSSTDASWWYADADGDGFGDPASATIACESPAGSVADDSDQDDTHADRRYCDEVCDVTVSTTIQAAISAAADGDVVCVPTGVWYENIDFAGRDIELVGESMFDTIIDGGAVGATVSITTGEDASVVNLTIRNGNNGFYGGLAVGDYCGGSALPANVSLRSVRLTGNTYYGVGVGCSSNLTIENSLIDNNYSRGVYLFGTSATVEMTNVTVADNGGTGVSTDGANSQAILENSILYSNGQYALCAYAGGTSISYDYSNFSANTPGELCAYSGTYTAGASNSTGDPALSAADYSLLSGSTVIDAGNPSSSAYDLDGSPNDLGYTGGPNSCL